MCHTEVSFWVRYFTAGLRRSQQTTLAALVPAVMVAGKISLAEIGRQRMGQTGVAAKHAIKQADRYLANTRIEPTVAMGSVIRWLAGPSQRLLVSLDWVDLRSFHCLMLAAWYRGRAIPLLWHVTRWAQLHKSQNSLEYGLLTLLKTLVGDAVEVTILADRGFGRAELARRCQRLQFHYIVRIEPSAYVVHPGFTGRLHELPVTPGQQRCLRGAAYRKRWPVIQNVAVYWHPHCEQPWFLMTDLPRLRAQRLAQFYARRMTIEEYFRDLKSRRTGWGLRMTLIRGADRLERLLLVLALAYVLLIAIGRYLAEHVPPRRYCSNNRRGECSYFFLARIILQNGHPPRIRIALRELRNDLSQQLREENWG